MTGPFARYNQPDANHSARGLLMSRRLLAFVPVVLLAAVGCGPSKPKPEPATESAPPTTSKPSDPADPNAPTADRTLDYWNGVAKAQEIAARKYAALAEPKPDEVGKLLTDAAKEIDALPTEKADPEAVAAGKGLADGLRKRVTDPAAGNTALAATVAKARTARAELAKKYAREFSPLDTPPAKPAAFRLVADLERPTAAQEIARLKGEAGKLDEEAKKVGMELANETASRDMLQSAADQLKSLLKDQKEDRELREVRQATLDDTLKDIEAKKKVIEPLAKKRDALRTRKAELDRLALDLAEVLKDGDPEKAATLSADKLELFRQRADKLTERIDAQKGNAPAPPPGGGK